jgi:hypothetical protein
LTSIQILLVHALDSLVCFLRTAIGNEPEASGSSGLTVHDNDSVLNGTELGECLLELFSTGVEGEIADKDFSLGLEEGREDVLVAF